MRTCIHIYKKETRKAKKTERTQEMTAQGKKWQMWHVLNINSGDTTPRTTTHVADYKSAPIMRRGKQHTHCCSLSLFFFPWKRSSMSYAQCQLEWIRQKGERRANARTFLPHALANMWTLSTNTSIKSSDSDKNKGRASHKDLLFYRTMSESHASTLIAWPYVYRQVHHNACMLYI